MFRIELTSEKFEATRILLQNTVLSSASQQVMGPLMTKELSSSLKANVHKLVQGKFHFCKDKMETIFEDQGILEHVQSKLPQPEDLAKVGAWRKGNITAKNIIKMGLRQSTPPPYEH